VCPLCDEKLIIFVAGPEFATFLYQILNQIEFIFKGIAHPAPVPQQSPARS
jgi:hypothetical protein